MIYLLPWTKEKDNFEMIVLYHRKELGTNKIFATIEYNMAAGKWRTGSNNQEREHPSFEKATNYVDECFIESQKITGNIFYFIAKNDVKRFEEKLIVLL